MFFILATFALSSPLATAQTGGGEGTKDGNRVWGEEGSKKSGNGSSGNSKRTNYCPYGAPPENLPYDSRFSQSGAAPQATSSKIQRRRSSRQKLQPTVFSGILRQQVPSDNKSSGSTSVACDNGSSRRNDNPNGRAADPVAEAYSAFSSIRLPLPDPQTSPGFEDLVPQLRVWLWLPKDSWKTVKNTVVLPSGVTATATSTPVKAAWTMGDGRTVCRGPGEKWQPGMPENGQRGAKDRGDCFYTYHRSSAGQFGGAFSAKVTVTWKQSFTLSGMPGAGYPLSSVQRTTSFDARVGEIQALETG